MQNLVAFNEIGCGNTAGKRKDPQKWFSQPIICHLSKLTMEKYSSIALEPSTHFLCAKFGCQKLNGSKDMAAKLCG